MNVLKQSVILICCMPWALLAQTQLNLQLTSNSEKEDASRLFSTADDDIQHHSWQQHLSLKWQQYGVSLHAGFEGFNSSTKPNQSDYEFYEGFYDFSVNQLDFSIGRKLMTSGVGYGFRPLDMIQQEKRQSLLEPNLKGVDVLTMDYFSDNGNISLVYKDEDNGLSDAIALKGYHLIGDADVYWLLHYQELTKTSLAVGFSWVQGDALELHASARIQEESPSTAQNTSLFLDQIDDNHILLLGLNWSHVNGISIIAEYWYDSMAPSQNDWESILNDQRFINSGGVINANNAMQFNTLSPRIESAFSQPNLQRNNVFIRFAYDAEYLDPKMDVSYHPDDGGYSITLRADHEISDQQQLSFAWRQFAGDTDSVMRHLPEQQQLSIQWEFFNAF